jgi:sec-independent protein translocase protein TatA
MFGNLGFPEIMLLAVVVLLVFGAKRLPEIGQSLGKGIREFKRSFSDAGEAVTAGTDDRSPTSRQIDAPAQPTSSEPKRLSQ